VGGEGGGRVGGKGVGAGGRNDPSLVCTHEQQKKKDMCIGAGKVVQCKVLA
jgi:hypothetical protein